MMASNTVMSQPMSSSVVSNSTVNNGPEENVDFLCNKFTQLFESLRLSELEKSTLQGEKTALTADVASLRADVAVLRADLGRANQEKESLRQELDSETEKLTRERAENRMIRGGNEELKNLLLQKQENDELQATEEGRSFTNQLIDLERKCAEISAEKEALLKRNTSLDDMVTSKMEESESLRLQIKSLKKMQERKDTELQLQTERWSEEVSVYKQQKDELQKNCKLLTHKCGRVEKLLAEIRDLRTHAQSMTARMNALRKKNSKLESEHTFYESVVGVFQEQEKKLKEKVQDEMKRNSQLEQEKEQLAASRLKVLSDLSEKTNEIDSHLERGQEQHKKVLDLLQANEEAKRQLENKDQDLKDLDTKNQDASRENASLKKLLEELRCELTKLFEEKEKSKLEYEEMTAKMEHWRKRSLEMEPELATAHKQLYESEQKLHTLEEELLHEAEERAKFQRESRNASDRARKLTAKCSDLTNKIKLVDVKGHFSRAIEKEGHSYGKSALGGSLGNIPLRSNTNNRAKDFQSGSPSLSAEEHDLRDTQSARGGDAHVITRRSSVASSSASNIPQGRRKLQCYSARKAQDLRDNLRENLPNSNGRAQNIVTNLSGRNRGLPVTTGRAPPIPASRLAHQAVTTNPPSRTGPANRARNNLATRNTDPPVKRGFSPASRRELSRDFSPRDVVTKRGISPRDEGYYFQDLPHTGAAAQARKNSERLHNVLGETKVPSAIDIIRQHIQREEALHKSKLSGS